MPKQPDPNFAPEPVFAEAASRGFSIDSTAPNTIKLPQVAALWARIEPLIPVGRKVEALERFEAADAALRSYAQAVGTAAAVAAKPPPRPPAPPTAAPIPR